MGLLRPLPGLCPFPWHSRPLQDSQGIKSLGRKPLISLAQDSAKPSLGRAPRPRSVKAAVPSLKEPLVHLLCRPGWGGWGAEAQRGTDLPWSHSQQHRPRWSHTHPPTPPGSLLSHPLQRPAAWGGRLGMPPLPGQSKLPPLAPGLSLPKVAIYFLSTSFVCKP